jgi:hypothetical protein
MQPTHHDITEQPSPWEGLTLASGIVAGALQFVFTAIFVALILPDLPPLDAPAAQAVAFYAQQSHDPVYRLTSYLVEFQMVFLMLFFGGLFSVLRRADGGSGALAAAIFAAGIALAVITPLADMIEDHLLLGLAADGADPVTARGFDGMVPVSQALSGFPQAVVLCGTAALILARRLAPRWLAWLGFALGALSLAGTGMLMGMALFPLPMLVTLLFNLWILALSVALLRGTRSAQAAARGALT